MSILDGYICWKRFDLCISQCHLALKKLSVGNMGDQKKLHLFSLSSYVQNNYLNDIADACLCWEWFEHREVVMNNFSNFLCFVNAKKNWEGNLKKQL